MSLSDEAIDRINSTSYEQMVDDLAKPGQAIVDGMNAKAAHILHMSIGIAGEAGELLDAIKKHVIYGKDLDVENVIEELGDLEFYMEGLRAALYLSRKEILMANKVKLLGKRYASGTYSDDQAKGRADKE